MGPTGATSGVFKVADLVFAKVVGFPHWPAQVTEVREEGQTVEYCVAFYGSHEIAYVKAPLVCEYNEENIKKFEAVPGKTKKKSLILSYQKAMEECASGVTFLNCDVDEEEEEGASIDKEIKVADLSRSMTSDEEALQIDLQPPKPPTPVAVVPKAPKRGRPPKKEAAQNNQASKRKSLRVATASKTLSMPTVDVDSKPIAIPCDDDEKTEEEEDPLKIDNVFEADTQIIEDAEGSSGNAAAPAGNAATPVGNVATPVGNAVSSGEGSAIKSTPVIPAADTSITSRSGRRIKPKKFADEVSSPMSDHLVAALKSSQASPAKKRKVSQDESTEDESSEPVQNGVNNGHVVPKKTKKSLPAEDPIPNEEKPIASLPKRRSGKYRALSDDSSSGTASPLPANISWKVEAMKPLEDKLTSSCKLIEILQHEDESSNEDLVNVPSPEQDKDAERSAPPVVTKVETLPAQSSTSTTKPPTPVITKSNGANCMIDALAKVVAGESSRKANSKSTTLRNFSVGTSTDELLQAAKILNPVIVKPEPKVEVEDTPAVATMTNGDSNVIVSNVVEPATVPEKATAGKSIIKVKQAMAKAVATATRKTVEALASSVNQIDKLEIKEEKLEMNQQVTSAESAADEKNELPEVVEPRPQSIPPPASEAIQPPASEGIQPQASEAIQPPASDTIQAEVGATDMTATSKSNEESVASVDIETPATPKGGPGAGPASKTPLKKKVIFSEDTKSYDSVQSIEASGASSEGTSKTPVATKKSRAGILRKSLTKAEEIKIEQVTPPARRPQRNAEAPSRFKDSIALPLVATPRSYNAAAKAIQNGKKSEPTRAKRPRTEETEEMNGSRTSGETEDDDEDADDGELKLVLTEEDFLDEESKQKFKSKLREKTVMDTLVQITDAVMDTYHDLDHAIELLVKFQQPGFVDKAILKKFPEIVQVVRKMQYFVGNPKVKMSKFQKAELPSKTEKIREQAEKTLESFKEIMSTNEKPLAVLMMEEMQRKSIEGSE